MKSLKQIVGIACASLMMVACTANKDEAKKDAVAELPVVKVQKVFEADVPQISEYTATVEAFKTNNISANTPNRIKKILVDVGSNVRAGQKLVVFDDVNVEQAKLRLTNQKVNLDRAKELLRIGGGTQQNVDQLQTEYDAANRAYTNLLENTVLVSPISGVVTARNYDSGDMVSALPVLVIEQQQPVKVIVKANEADFPKIKTGMKVPVKLDVYGDEEFTGTVYLIHPTIDPASRTFEVEITIANNGNRVRTGMFARVTFDFGSVKHVVVPDLAVVKQTGSGNRYVYVYKDGKVSFNKVELGRRIEGMYELLSGVESGDDVVVSGQVRLFDGAEVSLESAEKTAAKADTTATK